MATRLYFHNATTGVSNLPATEQCGNFVPDASVDAQSVNRTMDTTIGTGQISKSFNNLATTSFQYIYITKFVSPPLSGVSSISANTWTFNFAARESDLNANWPVGGVYQVACILYVWRTSNSSLVGRVHDYLNNTDVTEGAAANTEYSFNTTFSGAAVSSVVDNDRLIWEEWSVTPPAVASVYTSEFIYDGTTVQLTSNQVVSNHASFIETPQTLTFAGGGPITMTDAASKTYANKFITKV